MIFLLSHFSLDWFDIIQQSYSIHAAKVQDNFRSGRSRIGEGHTM